VAEYYSILSKAVSALEPNTASARQRLYERARSAISAEIEEASPPFEASDIAAVKQGLKSAIERIEAEALPAWIQQPERAVCANDRPVTADLPAEIEGACHFRPNRLIASSATVRRSRVVMVGRCHREGHRRGTRDTERPAFAYRNVMEYSGERDRSGLDARELDHLRPLLGFVGDMLAKLGRCHRHRNAA
jgi:hypothetical protein